MFYKNEALGVVIDGPTAHTAAKELGFQIDWKSLHGFFAERGKLLRAVYLTPVFDTEGEHNPLMPLIDWLEYNGFDVVKQNARIEDNGGERAVKGRSLHVKFTLAAMQLAQRVDHIILFTSDGAYSPLVRQIKSMGVRVTVCGAKTSTSDSLRRQADHFIDLAQLSNVVGKGGE